ncbi:C39 family peptidase [Geobacter sp.]|uniref:C39 family peptidase n=1 Tax=Geobacter sp. TaxID=46610 RepID=UPI00262ED86B|nr:C39 family peptidase [Geobacter sp.]
MKSPLTIRQFLGTFAILAASSSAVAATMTVPGGNGDFTVKVMSMQERRFRSTIRQQNDFSCGSAALATLLTYHYEDKVSEQQVFDAMFDAGDQERIRREGFSMLDMKKYLEANGYGANGYKIDLPKLAKIGVPAIALINHNGYKHFVVVKGVTAKEVLLGDPSLGTRTVQRPEFEKMWNGLVFIVLNKKNVAQHHFNNEKEWRVREKAPLGMALSPSELANMTLFLPGRNDF